MLEKYIKKLTCENHLSRLETKQAIMEMIDHFDHNKSAAFLSALHSKGETAEEIQGTIDAMLLKMIHIKTTFPVLDIVGTGGDCSNTVNISTGSAILAASCDIKVVKHGNRSISSRCGSADVLEELGIDLNCEPEITLNCLAETNFGFCFAPHYHPSFKELRTVRKQLSTPTIFNLIGPLLNPAGAQYLMIGVFSEKLMDIMAEVVLGFSHIKKALIFHSSTLDELSCSSIAKVIEVTPLGKKNYLLFPENFGFKRCKVEDLKGGDSKKNANILKEVFEGVPGAVSDTLIFNAATALYVYGKTSSIEEAVPLVKEKIYNGSAYNTLKKIIQFHKNLYA